MLEEARKACFNGPMTSDDIVARLGGTAEVARLCECSPQAVSQWIGVDPATKQQREIPRARLLYLKAIRPDVFEERRKHAAKADTATQITQPNQEG